jgi:hypothetical protein
MNVRSNQPHRNWNRGNIPSTKPKARRAEWRLADDQLDEALRQTFPASDALSIVQSARCTLNHEH